MYLKRAMVAEMERRLGEPRLLIAGAEFAPHEFGLVQRCLAQGRAHDLTVVVRDGAGRFALIRKHSYPPDVFRPPSGGAERGESPLAGAAREVAEETGLRVEMDRYLLRIRCRFTCGELLAPWTTHVLSARVVGGELSPGDVEEIASARWGTLEEVCGPLREAMLRMAGAGSGGMRFRVELQDAALHAMGLAPPREAFLLRPDAP